MRRRAYISNHTNGLLDTEIPFIHNRPLQLLVLLFVLLWCVAAISPTNRQQWLMENLLPVGLFLTLIFSYRRLPLTNLSYLLIFLFLCFHLFAAHYTYQNTPVDLWLKTAFHTRRSYFDRLVHFLFGLLLAYPFRELFIRTNGQRGFWSYAMPLAVTLALGAFYEICEVGVALLAGNAGADYIGAQGDIYDTQKDMAMGLSGSIIAMGALAWVQAGKGVFKNKKRLVRSRFGK